MKPARRLAIVAGLIVATQAAAYAFLSRKSILGSMRERLAPEALLHAPEVVGRISPDKLSAGTINALVVRGHDMFLLQEHSWSAVVNGVAYGPFGAASRGAVGWIASGADMAVGRSEVFVLDRVARSIISFDLAGNFKRSRKIELDEVRATLLPERFAIADTVVYVTAHNPLRGSWDVLRLERSGPARVILRVPGSALSFLLPAVGPGGNLLVASSMTYVIEHTNDGRNWRRFRRKDPPLARFADSTRHQIERYATAAGLSRDRLPDHLPIVVTLHARPGKTVLAALSADESSVLVEEIDSLGEPLRTLTREPLPLPIALTDAAVYTLREEADVTLIERRRLR